MKIPGILYIQGRNSYPDADGTKYGIAIHNTSNDGTARDEASYAQNRTDGISAHIYADGQDVIQSLDTTARAGHAGSSNGNQNAVAVEIVGTNGMSRDWWLSNVDWATLGRALAAVCATYGISVRRASVPEMISNSQVRAFYSHDDMRRAWGGTTHDDPGPNFPWDRLFSAVNGAIAGEAVNMAIEDTTSSYLWLTGHADGVAHNREKFLYGAPDQIGKPVEFIVEFNKVKAQVLANGSTLSALSASVSTFAGKVDTMLASLTEMKSILSQVLAAGGSVDAQAIINAVNNAKAAPFTAGQEAQVRAQVKAEESA